MGHFLFCGRGYLDLAPRQRQLAGSKTSRLWKCNAPHSSRFPSRRSRWNPPTKIFFDIILIIVYQGSTHSHQKIRRASKVRFFFGFCTIREVRKYRIYKTLIFTNLRTVKIFKSLPRSNPPRRFCVD